MLGTSDFDAQMNGIKIVQNIEWLLAFWTVLVQRKYIHIDSSMR